MNNQDVRQHLRKGELAVAQLETLGFTYEVRKGWSAPELKPKHLSREEAIKALKELMEGLEVPPEAKPTEGPNWHLVKDMVGKFFRIRPENIPLMHPLRDYGSIHFNGVNFKALSIQYERSATYTGYTVSFEFPLRAFHPQEVRLPLSCAAFR